MAAVTVAVVLFAPEAVHGEIVECVEEEALNEQKNMLLGQPETLRYCSGMTDA